MPKKSAASDLVRRSAGKIPPATPEHLAKLAAGKAGPVDTSDIPELVGPVRRVKRDALGRLPKRREGPIRSAILAGLERRRMTRYQLWKKARAHCVTLPQSAVYEYLRGQRDIGIPYVEALMAAVGLEVRPRGATRKGAMGPAPSKRRVKANA